MKKLKTILAIMLAMVIMCFSVSSAFATENINDKILELSYYISQVAREFNIYIPNYAESIDGDIFLQYTNETYSKLESELLEAAIFVNDYYLSDEDITIEQINDQTNAINKAYSKIVLEKSELDFLIAYCKPEINDAYYSDEIWNCFIQYLKNAEMILADESIIDTRINDAYWDLFGAYNQLCLYNDVKGDVDHDGDVTILDATQIQRYLAKLNRFNSSQKLIGCVASYSDISILDATEIQRYIAKLCDDSNWCYGYNNLVVNEISRDINSNLLFYNALVDNHFGS